MVQMFPARVLPPAEEASDDYDLKSLSAPLMMGYALRAFISLLESPAGTFLYPILMWQSGITQVLHGVVAPEQPTFLPELTVEGTSSEPGCIALQEHDTAEEAVASALTGGFLQKFDGTSSSSPSSSSQQPRPWRASIRDYVYAYNSGSTNPTEAMEHLVAFIRASAAKKCAWLVAWSEEDIMRQARESTERYKSGSQRLLEGVPFVVKDVLDALPYPTTAGTSFLSERRPVTASCPFVVALQRMGAILLGKSNMHEIGLGVTGLNVRTGTPLNPWNLQHYTGGSSGGSGALVGAGVCPIAIGSDGGGSIRIPSSFCGCVGLKPTMGRLTGHGGVEIDCTVATYGPMGGSVEDCAILYAAMANQDTGDFTLHGERMPPPRLPHPLPLAVPTCHEASSPQPAAAAAEGDDALPLAGVKIGVFWQWFNDSDPEVLASCRAAVEQAVAQGATLVEVSVPELELQRVAHTVTIASEMHHCMQRYWDDPATRACFNSDVRLALGAVKNFTSADYIAAQRIRARGTKHWRRALQEAVVVVTPSTPCTAPAYSPAAITGGACDLAQTSKIMRFAGTANLMGLPAVSVPVGCDSKGMPIGLQFIGRPWAEATLLRLASIMESALWRQEVQQPPAVWVNPLTGRSAGL